MIVVVYFGVFRANRALGVALFAVLGVAFIATSPYRWGIGMVLHYLSRVYWPDPADPVPKDVGTAE